jgi:DNA adenine methylase
MKTFINWSGNKSKHISKFEKYLPDSLFEEKWKGTYIEPFVGSGALLLYLEPNKWIINDLNKDLINVWKNIYKNPKKITSSFKLFGKKFKDLSKDNKIKECREITNKIDEMPYDNKRASTYMLMKYCAYMGNILLKNKFYFTSFKYIPK